MILGPIVRIHFKRLECPRLQWFQVRAVALLAWWGVPFTLLAFFGRYLVRHDALITTLQVILVGISTWLSLLFWRITKDTLHGTAVSRTSLGKVVLSREVLGGVVTALLFGIFSKGMLLRDERGPMEPWSWKTAAPSLLEIVGWRAFGDLYEAELSRKPENWDRKNLDAVKGAQLGGASLRNIRALRAFCVRAAFWDSDLRDADLDSADLRGADFTNAKMDGANLSHADLRFAALSDTDLSAANIDLADVQDAELGSVLPDKVKEPMNWYLAHLSKDTLRKLHVCPDKGDCDTTHGIWVCRITLFVQVGIGTVRICFPLPIRSAMTQCPFVSVDLSFSDQQVRSACYQADIRQTD